jgi:hypothetical protein
MNLVDLRPIKCRLGCFLGLFVLYYFKDEKAPLSAFDLIYILTVVEVCTLWACKSYKPEVGK